MLIFTQLPLESIEEGAYFATSAAKTPKAVKAPIAKANAVLTERIDKYMDLFSFTIN